MHRRKFLLAAAGLLAVPAALAAEDGPVAMLAAIYRRVCAGKGNGGGTFMLTPNQRSSYFTEDVVKLWDRADARTKPGEAGPIDFDPIANSQHPSVKAFAIKVETMHAEVAGVAVSLADNNGPVQPTAANTLHYVLVKMNGRWRIDDISGIAAGKPWSLRKLLEDFER